MQPSRAAVGHMHAADGRNDALQSLTDNRFDSDGAEQAMFRGEAGKNGLVNRVGAMGDAGDVDA